MSVISLDRFQAQKQTSTLRPQRSCSIYSTKSTQSGLKIAKIEQWLKNVDVRILRFKG